MGSVGDGNDPGDSLIWDGSKKVWSPEGIGSFLNEENYSIALAESAVSIWPGTPADGIFVASAVLIPASFTANKLSSYIVTPAPIGTMAMGVYDSSGNLLGQTGYFAPSQGFNTQNILTPFVLAAEQLYYLAITSRSNGSEFLRVDARYTGVTPHLAVEDPNGNAGTSMRASFDVNSNGVIYRYWQGIFS